MRFYNLSYKNKEKFIGISIDGNELKIFPNKYFNDINTFISSGKFSDNSFLEMIENEYPGYKKLKLSVLECNNNSELKIQKPYQIPEIWAVGVTYEKIKDSHEEEMRLENRIQGIYDYVYNSERPEVFFKGLNHHCVGPFDPFFIRSDSIGPIIEGELALILNSNGDIIGYTLANDVTAWDIEKENPLFLNQAKIYEGCLVIGPCVVPKKYIPNPNSLRVHCLITRNDDEVFKGTGNTAQMKRTVEELSDYLLLNNKISNGTILCTGTAIGCPYNFAVEDRDVVKIWIDEIGVIMNSAIKHNT